MKNAKNGCRVSGVGCRTHSENSPELPETPQNERDVSSIPDTRHPIPLYPGVYSAMGLVMSDVKHDFIRSRLTSLAAIDEAGVNAVFADLEAQARAELAAEGFAAHRIAIEFALDMRYAGQGYEMTLPCRAPLGTGDVAALRQTFDEQHRRTFGHTAPGEPVEIVSYRLRGIGRVPPVELPRFSSTGASLDSARRATRTATFGGREYACPVYQREGLDVGLSIAGPAIVDQLDCTTVLPPGQTATVDTYKNLVIELGAA